MARAAGRAAIFRALALGLDQAQVRQSFHLTEDELRHLFQEAADHYGALEEGVWSVFCDGASRGNPGLAGAGVVLVAPDGEVREQHKEFLGQVTNNVAEYRGLLLALRLARSLGISRLKVYSDSELLVRQITGSYRVRQPHLLALWQESQQELQGFANVEIFHVPREMNQQADRLANQAIDQRLEPR
ncbi:MAG: ribonuclease HI family protein [Desulfobaccales bacterium]